MRDEILLSISDLCKSYLDAGSKKDGVMALDGITLDVRRGETLAIIGESGAGKSTLLRLMAALERPDSGKILFQGKDLCTMRREELRRERREFQMIFQNSSASLDPLMSVERIIREPLEIHNEDAEGKRLSRKAMNETASALMAKVGLSPDMRKRRPKELSGGERQRVAIARAIALGPKLILADEPLSSLDVPVQAQILNLLLTLKREMDLTLVMITHNLGIIRAFASRVLVLYRGRMVELVSAERFGENAHPYTRSLILADNATMDESDSDCKPGCPFACHCPECDERCKRECPPFSEIENDHMASCWHMMQAVPFKAEKEL